MVMYKSSLDSFFEKGYNLYYRVANADGKVWYVSNKYIKTSLQLYQPSSFKGKIFKLIFPLIKSLSFLYKFLGVTTHHYRISLAFSSLMCDLFKVDKIDIAVFEGTPSVHQKATIQVSCKNRILGYCKISGNADVKALFYHEEFILRKLNDQDLNQNPKCLFSGPWHGNENIFVQSTVKTHQSKVLHNLARIHWNYLQQMFLKTRVEITFEESDLFKTLQLLKQNLHFFTEENQILFSQCISHIEKFFGSRLVEFAFFHSDFTPWNMFVERGSLFVFDWEYSKRTYPPYLDAYHFFTQTCIFEKKLEAEDIYDLYTTKKNTFTEYIENSDMMFQCYLLSIISLYIGRDNGVVNAGIKHNLNVWINLLHLLNNAAH